MRMRALPWLALPLVLAGCASDPSDGGPGYGSGTIPEFCWSLSPELTVLQADPRYVSVCRDWFALPIGTRERIARERTATASRAAPVPANTRSAASNASASTPPDAGQGEGAGRAQANDAGHAPQGHHGGHGR